MKRFKAAGDAPFVEVSGDDCGIGFGCGVAYFSKLFAPVVAQQAKVGGDKRELRVVEIDPHSTARFKAAEGDVRDCGFAKRLACQNRVAMKTKTCLRCCNVDNLEIGFFFNHLTRDGGWAVAEAVVSLLQGYDVSVEAVDHLKYPLGRADLIQATGFSDIITGDAYGFSCHTSYIGM